jgi:hypothetical protein
VKGLAVVLALSLGLNAYELWGHRHATAPAAVAPDSDASALFSRSPTPAASPAVLAPTTDPQRAALEARITELERRIDARIAAFPKERFEQGSADPEAEAAARPLLDRLFAGAHYEFACRVGICRISSDAPGDWETTIQDDMSYRTHFNGMEFTGNDAYVVLEDPVTAASRKLAVDSIKVIAEDVRRECSIWVQSPGQLTLSRRRSRSAGKTPHASASSPSSSASTPTRAR